MNSKHLRVGVIGAGGIARSVHLPALYDIESCDLVWICDLLEQRARDAAERWGAHEYGTDYTRLLQESKPDAVFVLVQPELTFRIALDCIHAGCHVFMEKPMGVTLYQAETLAREAAKARVQCQIGLNRRFIPLIQTVLQKLTALGPIHQVDGWFYKNGDAAFYGGCASAFVCDAVHTIDLVRYIADSEAVKTARLSARYGESAVNNAWNCLIQFENGITGTVHANYATGGRVHGFAIHNSFASAYIDIGFGGEACSARILYHKQGTFSLSSQGAGEQSIEILDGMQIASSDQYYRYYGYYNEDKAFIEAILCSMPVSCNAEDVLNTMRLVDQLERSDI